MIEQYKSNEDYLRYKYWKNEGTKKGISQFLGSTVLDWEKWGDGDVKSEFLGVSTRNKLRRFDKPSPSSIIEPYEFSKECNEYGGQVELQNSMWQRSGDSVNGLPVRSLLFWDIEIYDNNNPLSPVYDSIDTFDKLYDINRLMERQFNYYGIQYQTIMSGRGYNFVTQVDSESSTIEDLFNIAGTPEQTVLDKQLYPNPNLKRRKIVPVDAELLHLASVKLQQFLFNQIIREARITQSLNVEVSDKGEYGVALDNTAIMYSVENRTMGTLGSPYFMKLEKNNPDFVKTLVKIPILGTGFSIPTSDALNIRSDYDKTDELIGDVNCEIPEGSVGVSRLINDYRKSELYKFHQALDQCLGDNPDKYDDSYRNYNEIATQTENPERIMHLINNANDELLKPDNLDYFIWQIFNTWGGTNDWHIAGHVAGLLRAIYEDGSLDWGTRFMKTDAQRFARGWVATVIGQAFEETPAL